MSCKFFLILFIKISIFLLAKLQCNEVVHQQWATVLAFATVFFYDSRILEPFVVPWFKYFNNLQ